MFQYLLRYNNDFLHYPCVVAANMKGAGCPISMQISSHDSGKVFLFAQQCIKLLVFSFTLYSCDVFSFSLNNFGCAAAQI